MGRNVDLTDNGKIFFHEGISDTSGGGPFKVTFQLTPAGLTANRTILVDDQDGLLQGLAEGTGWPVTKGGTGLTSLASNVMLAGSGSSPMTLISAPTTHNQALFYDGDDGQIKWTILDLTGVEVTTARNLSDATPGIYASKLGSELRFRNIVSGGNGVTVTQGASAITVGFDSSALTLASSNITGTFPFTKITGTVPVTQGGTGFTSIANNELVVGASSTVGKLAAPTLSGQRLTWNGSAMAWERMVDVASGHIDFPIAQTYYLSIYWPYAANVDSISVKTAAGTCSYQLLADSTTLSSGSVSSTQANTTLTSKTIAVGQQLKLALSSLSAVSSFQFSIKFTRTT